MTWQLFFSPKSRRIVLCEPPAHRPLIFQGHLPMGNKEPKSTILQKVSAHNIFYPPPLLWFHSVVKNTKTTRELKQKKDLKF